MYDGEEVIEVEEELLESPEKVYNLTIEDFHTYVVPEENVDVYNKYNLSKLKQIKKSAKLINFNGDEAVINFEKYGEELMQALGKSAYK